MMISCAIVAEQGCELSVSQKLFYFINFLIFSVFLVKFFICLTIFRCSPFLIIASVDLFKVSAGLRAFFS